MKANEFIDTYGIQIAKMVLEMVCDELRHVRYKNYAIDIDDLKTAINDWENGQHES